MARLVVVEASLGSASRMALPVTHTSPGAYVVVLLDDSTVRGGALCPAR